MTNSPDRIQLKICAKEWWGKVWSWAGVLPRLSNTGSTDFENYALAPRRVSLRATGFSRFGRSHQIVWEEVRGILQPLRRRSYLENLRKSCYRTQALLPNSELETPVCVWAASPGTVNRTGRWESLLWAWQRGTLGWEGHAGKEGPWGPGASWEEGWPLVVCI